MPDPINFQDPDTALLRELLNRRPMDRNLRGDPIPAEDPLDATGNPSLPPVPHPGGFRPDPVIIGSPKLGQQVNDLYRLAPEQRGRVNSIGTAPSPGMIEVMGNSGIDPVKSNTLNIVGMHTPPQQATPPAIWLRNEGTYPKNYSMERVLGHEMGHVNGRTHRSNADNAETTMIELLTEKFLRGQPSPVPSH